VNALGRRQPPLGILEREEEERKEKRKREEREERTIWS
jgi:hypothetical protein